MRLLFALSCALCVLLATASASLAELTIVIHKEVAGTPAGLHSFATEEELAAKNLPEGSFARLTAEELEKLRAGETVLISDRMPMLDELHTAWGIAFAKVPAQKLFDLTLQYDTYKQNFPDILDIETFTAQDDKIHIVYLQKDAAVDVDMVLRYTEFPPSIKQWHRVSEADLHDHSPEVQEKIRARMTEDDFTTNSGAWYFVDCQHPAMGDNQAIIVRSVAVKLSGFLNLLKGPKAIKRSTEKEMPFTMQKMVELANASADKAE